MNQLQLERSFMVMYSAPTNTIHANRNADGAAMSDLEEVREMGPIDWMLIEFDQPLTGAAAPPLLDLVEQGLIRILDIMFIRKLSDGSVQAVEISELPGDEAVHVDVFDGLATGILGEADLAAAGDALEVDSRAVMLVYENSWAAPFAIAIREAGGFLVDQGRIPTQAIVAALDELDALDAELNN
jgi:hypothetical protein